MYGDGFTLHSSHKILRSKGFVAFYCQDFPPCQLLKIWQRKKFISNFFIHPWIYKVVIYPVDFLSFLKMYHYTLITSSNLFLSLSACVSFLLTFTPIFPLSCRSRASAAVLHGVILSCLHLAVDGGYRGSTEAQLIIAHAGPTEAMAVWEMPQPS